MLKKILLGIVAIVVVFMAVVALQPSDFRVTRSVQVSAPASEVFGQVNNLRKWDAWSPWAKLDPAAKSTFEGPEAGEGAMFAWAGNEKVGEGRMTVTESRPAELVNIKVDFVKPFAGTNMSRFDFKPAGNQTAVTWTTYGQHNFISKAFCLFMSMDRMLGGEMEKGLAQMKTVAEAAKR